jgi:hypothetical protein
MRVTRDEKDLAVSLLRLGAFEQAKTGLEDPVRGWLSVTLHRENDERGSEIAERCLQQQKD